MWRGDLGQIPNVGKEGDHNITKGVVLPHAESRREKGEEGIGNQAGALNGPYLEVAV